MSGKVNIVFGFIYLATTAVLGPVLLVPGGGYIAQTFNTMVEAVEKVSEGVKEEPFAEALDETTGRAVVSTMV